MEKKIVQIIVILILGTFLLSAAPQPGYALVAAEPKTTVQATIRAAGPTDQQELAAFMDDLLAGEMAEKHIPGAVVAVVKDGKLLLAKGYGYADLESQAAVDPESTLFRIGSVSKLITWTAVMQLVEEGKLSLDADVNEYLDFTIPATFPEPITLRALLSQTPGFEDQALKLWRLEPEQVDPLGTYLQENIPARVFPPGEVSTYSNYGAALAGYIVERVSGLPYHEYAARNIFEPLGMVHSTFDQPPPDTLAANLAKGYNYSGGQQIEGGFEYLLTSPGGSVSAPAADMARFMMAHLNNGELDGRRILEEATAQQMHSLLYQPDPRLSGGMDYGFIEETVNGQRVIAHDGATNLFYSGLYLIPAQNVGLFISTSGPGGRNTMGTVERAFLDHYYPAEEAPAPQPAPGFADRIAPYLGQYTRARSNFTSLEKMDAIMFPVAARLDSDGTLAFFGLHFTEVEPGLLQDVQDPSRRLVYRQGADGRRYLLNGTFAAFKTPWYGNSNLHRVLFLSGALLFSGALIGWPISYFRKWRRSSTSAEPDPLPARLARWAAALLGLLLFGASMGFVSIFTDFLPAYGVTRINFGPPPLMNFLLVLAYGLAVLTLALLVFAVLAWVRRYWSLGGRIFYTLLAVSALFMTWSLAYWQVIF